MLYATQQDMVERFGETELIQLTDDTDAGVIDATTLNRALEDAATEIDAHLEGRYTLPLASPPKVLTTYACDIARYRLYDDRASEQVTKRYDSAMSYLRAVAAGKVTLGLTAAGETAQPVDGPSADAPARVFTRDSLADYR